MAAQGGAWGSVNLPRPGLYFSWFGEAYVTYRVRWVNYMRASKLFALPSDVPVCIRLRILPCCYAANSCAQRLA